MRIIAKRTLREFWEVHPRGAEAKTPLLVWHSVVQNADWATPADVKKTYGDASILKNSRVVFNIGGNRFRLVVRINYSYRVVYVRFVERIKSTTRSTRRRSDGNQGSTDPRRARLRGRSAGDR